MNTCCSRVYSVAFAFCVFRIIFNHIFQTPKKSWELVPPKIESLYILHFLSFEFPLAIIFWSIFYWWKIVWWSIRRTFTPFKIEWFNQMLSKRFHSTLSMWFDWLEFCEARRPINTLLNVKHTHSINRVLRSLFYNKISINLTKTKSNTISFSHPIQSDLNLFNFILRFFFHTLMKALPWFMIHSVVNDLLSRSLHVLAKRIDELWFAMRMSWIFHFSSFLSTEGEFKNIMSHNNLWVLFLINI